MIRKSLTVVLALVALGASPGRVITGSASRVPAEILARAAEGPVRVIVRLDVPTLPESALGGEGAVAEQRDRIARAQEAALGALTGHVSGATRFQTLPAVAVTTNTVGLARLAALSLVAAVEADDVMSPSLLETATIVRADVLWGQGTEGSGWKVAILDSGIEKTHAFFTGRVTSEACYSTTDSVRGATSLCPAGVSSSTAVNSGINCTGTQGCEHGTQVAGIAAGRNALFSGMARAAQIVSVQIYSRVQGAGLCANQSSSPCLRSFESNVISALDRVLMLAGPGNAGRIGAVNLSASSSDPGNPGIGEPLPTACDSTNSVFTQAVENLRSVGIPTIVPSGNNSRFNAMPFPACVSRVVSVGATDKNGVLQLFTNASSQLSLVAPGLSVQTSALNNSLQFVTGTSFAAAHVSGGWTLLKGRAPVASVDTVLQALQLTGTPVGDPRSGRTFSSILLDRAAGSMGAAGSPTSVVVNISGSTVTASWSNPFDGTNPTGFNVEITSAATGTVVAIVNVGTARSFVTTLPNGSFLLRVRSITAAGPGAASSDVPFIIGPPPTTQAPFPPQDLRAEVSGQTVTAWWNMGGDSAPATTFVADVGTISGSSNLGSFDTGSNALSVMASGIRPGTYFLRMRARNVFGLSAPSNEVMLTVTGTGCAAPSAPGTLTATVVGSFVTLSWSQPIVGGAITSYTIEAGTGPGLSNVLQTTTGPSTLFSGNATPGVYYARVRAQNACGTSPNSNEVVIVVP